MSRSALFVLLAFAGLIAIAVVAASLARPTAAPTPRPTQVAATTTPAATVQPTRSPAPVPRGAITGALGYPSDFIPPLTVYAISLADQRTFFSVDTPRYPVATGPTPPQPTYTITGVAPGTYHVLAYRNDGAPLAEERPGVYSQYVLCGGTASCTDHTLAAVTVRAGDTANKIDVTDWYYPPGTRYPARPR